MGVNTADCCPDASIVLGIIFIILAIVRIPAVFPRN